MGYDASTQSGNPGGREGMRVPNLQDARKRSVDNLQRLYTVVVSLAVTQGLKGVMELYGDHRPTTTHPPTTYWFMLGTLIVTIIPFYHGANRYLDATYVTEERRAKHWALVVDFFALFLEGVLFFALASLIGKTVPFLILLAVLFAFDIIWVGVTRLTGEDTPEGDRGYRCWALVNLIAVFVVLLIGLSRVPEFWHYEAAPELILLLVAVVRSYLDYHLAWHFYYPRSYQQDHLDLVAPLPASLGSSDTEGEG